MCCWLTVVLYFVALNFSAAYNPEIDVHGEEFGWTQAEYDRQAWHRINDSSACRDRPPGTKNILYLLPYRENRDALTSTTYCHYYIADPERSTDYEMEIVPNGIPWNKCFSHRNGIRTDPNCPMSVLGTSAVVLYCQNNRDHNAIGYVAELKRPSSGEKYKYIVDSANIFFLSNNPPRLIHFQNKPNGIEYVDSIEGNNAKGYIAYKFPSLDRNRFFTCQTPNKYDGQMCELTYQGNDPVFTPINGAFNQYHCLRIRRGLVNYEASTTDVAGLSGDLPFGYIIENFNIVTGQILSQKCYFSPNFRKLYRVSNVYPVWVGSRDDLLQVCSTGLNSLLPPANPSTRDGTGPCQTALFPDDAEGVYRIIGMEPDNTPQRGIYGLPRLAVYNGVDSNPEIIGDPAGILKENCYAEENRDPTGLAHFGIRVLDETHFLVFCNKMYGDRNEFTDEQWKKGSTMILYEYLPPVKSGPNKRAGVLVHKGLSHLQVVSDKSFLRFLDNRGVMMIPKGDGKIFYFVQMFPCAYFKLDRSNPEEPKFTVKAPNNQADYSCNTNDISELISQTNVSFNSLKSGDDTPDPLQPCFMPFNQSSSFQIIKLNDNATCDHPWRFEGPPVTAAPTTTIGTVQEVSRITAPEGTTPTPSNRANCRNYFIDTLPAVAMAGAILVVCMSIFAAVVVASMIGRRRYAAQKGPETTGYTQTENTVTSAMSMLTPIPPTTPDLLTTTPTAKPGSFDITPMPSPANENLFSKIGDFSAVQKAKSNR